MATQSVSFSNHCLECDLGVEEINLCPWTSHILQRELRSLIWAHDKIIRKDEMETLGKMVKSPGKGKVILEN